MNCISFFFNDSRTTSLINLPIILNIFICVGDETVHQSIRELIFEILLLILNDLTLLNNYLSVFSKNECK
jgi:hypothetical protein